MYVPQLMLELQTTSMCSDCFLSILKVGRLENALGWYHSHPGYGCWLSGIDVGTQMLNQQYQEPWVAIVVDPIRTMSAGKVHLGAFRTYPKVRGYPVRGGREVVMLCVVSRDTSLLTTAPGSTKLFLWRR